MKTAVIGSGGREHALLWKLSQSNRTASLWALPGNAGTTTVAESVAVNLADVHDLSRRIRRLAPDLTIVGPEGPLAAGLVDRLTKDGLPCFGPTAAAANLEASKIFAKRFMQANGIPTADFEVFDDFHAFENYVQNHPFAEGWVVKADGLAAGKGAFVCSSIEDTLSAGKRMLVDAVLGEAGRQVVLERKLTGREASTHYFCDGENFFALPPAQDYKRALDRDEGPNTGGMGSYCPAGHLTAETQTVVEAKIVRPVLQAMADAGTPYRGLLYVGLMLTEQGPQVIEFNCRFGDPETQVMLTAWPGDLIDAVEACISGKLKDTDLPRGAGNSSVCVVLAAEGYPGRYEKSIPLRTVQDSARAITLHAGTARSGSQIISNGGRVLNAVGLGSTLGEARQAAYDLAVRLEVPGLRYRSDIAVDTNGKA